MNYHQRLQSALSSYANGTHPAALIAAAHGVRTQDVMAVIEGVPVGEISGEDDEPYVPVSAAVANQIASVTGGRSGPRRSQIAEEMGLPAPVIDAWKHGLCGSISLTQLRLLESLVGRTLTPYEPLHPSPPDPVTIPIHAPSTAPIDLDDEWPGIGYTVAAAIGDRLCGVMVERELEHWGIPGNSLLVCADRRNEYNWLRLNRHGWAIARWNADLGWCGRDCSPGFRATDVAWSMGIVEIRRCLPPMTR